MPVRYDYQFGTFGPQCTFNTVYKVANPTGPQLFVLKPGDTATVRDLPCSNCRSEYTYQWNTYPFWASCTYSGWTGDVQLLGSVVYHWVYLVAVLNGTQLDVRINNVRIYSGQLADTTVKAPQGFDVAIASKPAAVKFGDKAIALKQGVTTWSGWVRFDGLPAPTAPADIDLTLYVMPAGPKAKDSAFGVVTPFVIYSVAAYRNGTGAAVYWYNDAGLQKTYMQSPGQIYIQGVGTVTVTWNNASISIRIGNGPTYTGGSYASAPYLYKVDTTGAYVYKLRAKVNTWARFRLVSYTVDGWYNTIPTAVEIIIYSRGDLYLHLGDKLVSYDAIYGEAHYFAQWSKSNTPGLIYGAPGEKIDICVPSYIPINSTGSVTRVEPGDLPGTQKASVEVVKAVRVVGCGQDTTTYTTYYVTSTLVKEGKLAVYDPFRKINCDYQTSYVSPKGCVLCEKCSPNNLACSTVCGG
ncbi:hypothetical protein [Pyrobaculum neutrophilum]|uniref:Uncharacterized protein n=1 Tax=Pyrobaculum neutrophilum (strain DSM 2338 / JCM 9278 / NBRC 100436 / V24Sta) TaxID=444157 RepID=B1YDW1_PYRNV|nr:hypothetical protein [Pyrobaculum neutrophilum]ACB39974.1 hypothetical protein Tneu_1043 [Pyrobaculum neutrophilum V24Sta]